MVKFTIDGRGVEAKPGKTILEVASALGINIPTLCYHKALLPQGACRLCVVEISGRPRLAASCAYPVEEGIEVRTDSPRVVRARKLVAELLYLRCPQVPRVQELAREMGVDETRLERFTPDNENCILCGLCVRMCKERMGVNAIDFVNRGPRRKLTTPFSQHSPICLTCGSCQSVCPTGAIDLSEITENRPRPIPAEFNMGLTGRGPIYIPFPQAIPKVPVIDRGTCLFFQRGVCKTCESFCGPGAIHYDQEEELLDIDVGAVVLATGFEIIDPELKKEFGYGRYPNVLSSLQFERLLSASGPYMGTVLRPSDLKPPERIAFIQCVGSRERARNYCSSVCCMYATKEAIIVREHTPETQCTIFYNDLRAFGKGFYRYYQRARDEYGVRYVRSMISSVKEMQRTNNLLLRYVAEDGRVCEEEFDLVVFSVGMRPTPGVRKTAEAFGVELSSHGFIQTHELAPVETSRPGVYVAGVLSGPKDIPESVMEASAAASRIMALLAETRGSLVREKSYPPERDVSGQEPRIGVFVCHCGKNIAGVVNVAEVVQYARSLPNVVYAEDSLYTCSTDSCERVKQKIQEHDLNRVIVSSCTPRTHEPLFRDTIRQAGLNPYLFEMANIRDQCSWVHVHEPEKATMKAKDLVRMAVAKARLLTPLYPTYVDINHRALVLGGGLAGMTAALELAGQGFETHLLEKSEALGGNLRHLHYTLSEGGKSIQEYLADLIEEVERDPLIRVWTRARVERVDGSLGNFTAQVRTAQGELAGVEAGAIIVATGAQEHRPTEFLYDQDERVLTQRELEERLAAGTNRRSKIENLSSVVMIQCVDSRNDERPYCSRVCCSQALKLKKINPDAQVFILYRDLMSYGLKEEYYTRAREAGVQFIRYEVTEVPEVPKVGSGKQALSSVGGHKAATSNFELRTSGTLGASSLQVSVVDVGLRRRFDVPADLVVLSVPTVAPQENQELAQILKVPLDSDGFFLEAHMKLRPVDFATDGVFMCGLAHGPKFMEETIVQAQAAAARAATILSQAQIESQAMVPIIDLDKCIGCRVCEALCAYQAIKVQEMPKGKKAQVVLAACKGCGACSVACPQMANMLGHFTDPQLLAQIKAFGEAPTFSTDGFEPKILGFMCNWCAYAGADLAGVSRIPYQPNFHTVRVMCTGRIDPAFIVEAFLQGIDGVMVLGCHPGDCHYAVGNLYARDRMAYLQRVMEQVGLDPRRFKLDWISASEGARFAQVVNAFTDQVRALGPIG